MLRLELFVRDLEDGGASESYRPLQRGAARISLQDIATLPPDHPLVASGPVGGGIEIVLEVDDIEIFHEEVRRKWPIASELATRPWGLTDFRLLDPDGYYWRPTST
jgi:hypothetical protein